MKLNFTLLLVFLCYMMLTVKSSQQLFDLLGDKENSTTNQKLINQRSQVDSSHNGKMKSRDVEKPTTTLSPSNNRGHLKTESKNGKDNYSENAKLHHRYNLQQKPTYKYEKEISILPEGIAMKKINSVNKKEESNSQKLQQSQESIHMLQNKIRNLSTENKRLLMQFRDLTTENKRLGDNFRKFKNFHHSEISMLEKNQSELNQVKSKLNKEQEMLDHELKNEKLRELRSKQEKNEIYKEFKDEIGNLDKKIQNSHKKEIESLKHKLRILNNNYKNNGQKSINIGELYNTIISMRKLKLI